VPVIHRLAFRFQDPRPGRRPSPGAPGGQRELTTPQQGARRQTARACGAPPFSKARVRQGIHRQDGVGFGRKQPLIGGRPRRQVVVVHGGKVVHVINTMCGVPVSTGHGGGRARHCLRHQFTAGPGQSDRAEPLAAASRGVAHRLPMGLPVRSGPRAPSRGPARTRKREPPSLAGEIKNPCSPPRPSGYQRAWPDPLRPSPGWHSNKEDRQRDAQLPAAPAEAGASTNGHVFEQQTSSNRHGDTHRALAVIPPRAIGFPPPPKRTHRKARPPGRRGRPWVLVARRWMPTSNYRGPASDVLSTHQQGCSGVPPTNTSAFVGCSGSRLPRGMGRRSRGIWRLEHQGHAACPPGCLRPTTNRPLALLSDARRAAAAITPGCGCTWQLRGRFPLSKTTEVELWSHRVLTPDQSAASSACGQAGGRGSAAAGCRPPLDPRSNSSDHGQHLIGRGVHRADGPPRLTISHPQDKPFSLLARKPRLAGSSPGPHTPPSGGDPAFWRWPA